MFSSIWLVVASIVLLLFTMDNALVSAQPDGWKMTDRFYGFRYEIHVNHQNQLSSPNVVSSGQLGELLTKIQREADDYACFGWTQESPSKTIVGEVRCTKARGPIFQEKLRTLSDKVTKADFLMYEDTKIRLHFSSFKILPKERETCFLDTPHQCPEFSQRIQSSQGVPTSSTPIDSERSKSSRVEL